MIMFRWFRKRKRPDVSVVVLLDRVSSGRVSVRAVVNGHENDVAVALLLAMDLNSDLAKAIRAANMLYLDSEREKTVFE